MFKIQHQSSSIADKTNLSSLFFSRIFVFKDALILIYDDYISINNKKISFKTTYAKKIHPNILVISDGSLTYILDFDKKYIKQQIGCIKDKTIKENYLCINEEYISFGSYKIENEIKYGDFDYDGDEDTFYYTCLVNSNYFFIGTNKSSNINIYNDKLEEIYNDLVYVKCKEDNSPLYLRGMDSNNDIIVTLDLEGNITKYFINIVEDNKELIFENFEGNEKNNLFQDFFKKNEKGKIEQKETIENNPEDHIKGTNNEKDNNIKDHEKDNNLKENISELHNDEDKNIKDHEKDNNFKENINELHNDEDNNIKDHEEDIDNKKSSNVKENNSEYLKVEESVKNIDFNKTEESSQSKEIEDKTDDLSKLENLNMSVLKNTVEESVKNIFKESKNTVEESLKKEKSNNNLSDTSKNNISFLSFNKEDDKKTVEIPDFGKLNISSNNKELNNMSGIFEDKKDTNKLISEKSNSNSYVSGTKNNMSSMPIFSNANSSKTDIDSKNSSFSANNIPLKTQNVVDNKPVSKIPSVTEILSSSTSKIISDIKNIKVNKYQSKKYILKEFIIDTDMTELYNNILKIENVDNLRKDLEDKLLIMINNLKLRKGIDTSYVKDSIKYFDNKINQKSHFKIPFVYNKGIISDTYIETRKVDRKNEEDVCKVELERVYDTGSLIIINKDFDNKLIENKEINNTVVKETNEKKDNLNIVENKNIENIIPEKKEPQIISTPKKDEPVLNNTFINNNPTFFNNNSVNIPTFSFNSENNQPLQAKSSDIFNQFINTGSSIPVIKKEERKDDGKVPNAFSRFANSNNLYK